MFVLILLVALVLSCRSSDVSGTYPCDIKTDILFVMDTSLSIGYAVEGSSFNQNLFLKNYEKMKNLAKKIIIALPVLCLF